MRQKKLQKGVDKPKAGGYNGWRKGNGVFERISSKALSLFYNQYFKEGNGVFHVVLT
jgi:hypothetical protein